MEGWFDRGTSALTAVFNNNNGINYKLLKSKYPFSFIRPIFYDYKKKRIPFHFGSSQSGHDRKECMAPQKMRRWYFIPWVIVCHTVVQVTRKHFFNIFFLVILKRMLESWRNISSIEPSLVAIQPSTTQEYVTRLQVKKIKQHMYLCIR